MTDQKKIKGEVNIWKADMKGSLDSVHWASQRGFELGKLLVRKIS